MSKFTPRAEDVRALRDAEGISLCEAKRQQRRHLLVTEIEDLRGRWLSDREKFDRLLDVVEDIVRNSHD